MSEITVIMIGIGVGCFIITVYYQCKAIIRSRDDIRDLTSPISQAPSLPIPITNGIRVDNITEDLEIITPD